MIPIIGTLIENGLGLLAGAVTQKGTAWLKEKTGIDLETAFLSSEDLAKLKQFEMEHEEELQRIALESKKLDYEFKQKEDEETTKRWLSDNTAGLLNRTVRPATLVYVLVVFTLLAVTDGNAGGFTVKEIYIKAFNEVLWIVIPAYFGLRSFEKIRGKA